MSSFRCCVALFIYSFATTVTVSAINYPVGVSNCGESNWVNATPARAVTLNQGATEVMLALNLTDRRIRRSVRPSSGFVRWISRCGYVEGSQSRLSLCCLC